MTKPRSYSPELKEEAASLVLEKGYSIKEASEAIGVNNPAMHSWIKQPKKRAARHHSNSKRGDLWPKE